jgi:hypothetical protein
LTFPAIEPGMTLPLAAQTQLVLDPILPVGAVAILGMLLAAGTIAIYTRVGSRLSRGRNLTLLIFRLLGVALVLALLLQPSRLQEIPPPVTNRVTLVAVDDSRSMAQKDVVQGTRSQAARAILTETEITDSSGAVSTSKLRLFKFSEDATPIASATLLSAAGPTTRLHRSVSTMLSSLAANEGARALILLSDGHDFELVNPAKTGFMARQRQVPIYAVALGKQGKVRDAAVRITSYQPYTYVKQKARISAALRLIGCELETVNVDLLRGDKVVQSQRLQPGEEPEVQIQFEVSEPAVGQYEYEVRVQPLEGENDRENNHALTYLNVIDQQIQVLFLEGSPYWDTTFLQRSLMRNDKMNVDSIVQYAPGKARVIRKKAGEQELKIPTTAEEWRRYDVVVLGRAIDGNLLSADGLHQLENYVKDHGGTVIFSRGPAFGGDLAKNDLEPVVWSQLASEHVRLQIGREGQALAPFRAIQEQAEGVPDLIAGYAATDKKPLTATLASAQPTNGGDPLPGMVHRRFGEGQVLSIGVEGLWRWAFNAKVDGVNTLFDRFWDQMILWLMAGRDFLPTQQFSLRASSANIPLGEKIFFRAVKRDPGLKAGHIPLRIVQAGQEVSRTTLSASDPNAPDKLTAEFVPGKAGKFEATAQFPDGTKQTARFIVYDDNLEQTEVATDAAYLKRLCESSGGRLLKLDELGKLLAELRDEKAAAAPQTKLTSAWDRVWVFWLIGLVFGADWYLRRRWGLC